jgi:glycosyltransferase involved in cell wall biosynthesis
MRSAQKVKSSAEDVILCRSSALFDPEWYLARNPDVAAARIDPVVHYLNIGAAEGRDPIPFFDSDWYLANNPDVAASSMNPLVHYLRFGAGEGRDPHPIFHTDWYCRRNPEVSCNPLNHYLFRGIFEGRYPHPIFESDWSDIPKAAIVRSDIVFLSRSNREAPEPMVSIIVPVYNKRMYLQECLDSILSQSLRRIELICVDDGSTDGSTNLLMDYSRRDDRICLIRIAENSGPAAARNIGIQQARGQFIQFTDADDALPRDGIESLCHAILNDKVEIARGSICGFRGEMEDIGYHATGLGSRRCTVRDERELWIPWYHVCYLFSRRLIINHELLYPSLTDGEDPVFLSAALMKAEVVSRIKHVTYLRREGSSYNRTTVAHIVDFIRHIANVKRIFLESARECWNEGYRPYITERYQDCFIRSPMRTQAERAVIALALARAGLSADFRDILCHVGPVKMWTEGH